jgi:hypothetical protein
MEILRDKRNHIPVGFNDSSRWQVSSEDFTNGRAFDEG